MRTNRTIHEESVNLCRRENVFVGDISGLFPDFFFKGNSLLESAAIDKMHGVRGLIGKQGWRDDFPSNTARQFDHLVQVVKLLDCHMLEPRLPF